MPNDVSSSAPPILEGKDHAAPSVFRPENLLRKARRQKELSVEPAPPICVLDPDGANSPTVSDQKWESYSILNLDG